MRLSTDVLVVFAVLVAGCHAGSASTTSTSPPTSRSISPTTVEAGSGSAGQRTFQIHQVRLVAGTWLTIGLHPGVAPVQVRVVPGQPIELCPASLDGVVNATSGSWPPQFHFRTCRKVDGAGRGQLPATDGDTHVAFAVRALDAGRGRVVDVFVGYDAKDSFVEIIPPHASLAQGSVTFTPHSATAGAHVYTLPDYGSSPDGAVTMFQHGRYLRTATKCDFGSEIECVGGVTPNEPVTVVFGGRTSNGTLALFIAWA
jgi:hypothetical protein